jgi:hypothetical protein
MFESFKENPPCCYLDMRYNCINPNIALKCCKCHGICPDMQIIKKIVVIWKEREKPGFKSQEAQK